MKLQDIITRVQRQFGDDVQAQITIADIVRWANDACLEIVTINYTNQGIIKGTIPAVSGQGEYTLPADLLKLRSVRVGGLKLRHTTYEQLCELTDFIDTKAGDAECYWVYNDSLHLYPIPTNASGTVDIYYVKTPDILTKEMLTVEPDVPTMYHPRIVEYCIAQAAELDDNSNQYQAKMSQFQSNLQMLRQNGEQPESDSFYPSITYVSEYS